MNVGVLGVGYWGKNIIRNLLRVSELNNLYTFDKDKNTLKSIKNSYPEIKVADSLDEILKNKHIDAVFVVTPPETHFDIGKKVIESGKHLYLEKPFVTSLDDAKNLIKMASKNKLKIMSGHTFLYSPPVRKVKEILESGEIGNVEFISFRRINLGIHQKAVNVIWDLLPHDLSMILYWLGEQAVFKRGNAFLKTSFGKHPDVGSVFIEFENGVMAEGLVSWLSPKKIRETIIVGNKKMILYNDTEPEEKIKIYDKNVEKMEPDNYGEYQLSYRVGDVMSPRLDTLEPLLLMVNDFIGSITNNKNPLSDGEFGLKVTQIIEEILK